MVDFVHNIWVHDEEENRRVTPSRMTLMTWRSWHAHDMYDAHDSIMTYDARRKTVNNRTWYSSDYTHTQIFSESCYRSTGIRLYNPFSDWFNKIRSRFFECKDLRVIAAKSHCQEDFFFRIESNQIILRIRIFFSTKWNLFRVGNKLKNSKHIIPLLWFDNRSKI